MTRLRIDFAHDHPNHFWLGWLLALVGCCLFGLWLGRWYQLDLVHKQLANQEAKLSSTLRLQLDEYPTSRLAQPDAIHKPVQWGRLFSALEGAMPKNVALLSLAPSMETGKIKLTGVARDATSINEYVRRLQKHAVLQRVYLAEVTSSDEEEFVLRFEIVANWSVT